MSILEALARHADVLEGVAPFGFGPQKISYVIGLNADGSVASVSDIRTPNKGHMIPRDLVVPKLSLTRTSAILPNFLWDKSTYVLGVARLLPEGARDDVRIQVERDQRNAKKQHEAFVSRHLGMLEGSYDDGLSALARFLKTWRSDHFLEYRWPDDIRGSNIVFALEEERTTGAFIHTRQAARALWSATSKRDTDAKHDRMCLVTGTVGPIARTHSSLKGVKNGPSTGSTLVTFNSFAFESHGWKQGDNAPVSVPAEFAYTTVLNKLLAYGSKNKITFGDTTAVFWAEADTKEDETEITDAFYQALGYVDLSSAENKLSSLLARLKRHENLSNFAPHLDRAKFYFLGLAPNSGRMAVRFWVEDSFGSIAQRYQQFLLEMDVEPPDGKIKNPSLEDYLRELAVRGDVKNIPSNLSSHWANSIIQGVSYPSTLLANALIRVRSDGAVSALRAAIIKASLIRNRGMEVPVSLDITNDNKGYLLGRLFAIYEQIQFHAQGGNLNVTIKDRYYSAASSQPRRIFQALDRGSSAHLSKVGKRSPGLRVNLEKLLQSIMEMLNPDDDPFPTSLSKEHQGLFVIGYYHQKHNFYKSSKKPEDNASQTEN